MTNFGRRALLGAGTMLSMLPLSGATLAAPAIIKRARLRTYDALTFDRATVDSAGVFLISELERLDQTEHPPLVSVSWPRDIDLRTDVSIGDELSSFTNTAYAATGAPDPSGISWIGKSSTAIQSVAVDIGKTTSPLNLWGQELFWSIPELKSAQQLGRPIDDTKYRALMMKHEMDIDRLVYVGDPVVNAFGMCNSPLVTTTNVVVGATTGATTWALKNPDEILTDINSLIAATWAATGYSVLPTSIRLPPAQFGALVARKGDTTASISIMEFLSKNSLTMASAGVPLDIKPLKWLTGRGVGGKDRMIAYVRDKDRIRYPMTPLNNTPVENRGINQITTYFCRLGVVEIPYPETIAYVDGI